MANGDYGYFGKGDTGYAQYMTAFNRNFGGSSGGGGGGSHNNGGGGGRAGAHRHGDVYKRQAQSWSKHCWPLWMCHRRKRPRSNPIRH